MPRRRRAGAEPEPAAEGAPVDAPEHAWWAAGSTDPYAYARAEPEANAQGDEQPPAAPEPVAEEPPPIDPYEVLRVAPRATWDEVVAAHRRLVRWWHPDGLAPGASAEERDLCVRRMRELTEAYRALRVRRGR